jgi:hypothetical protein
MLTAVILRLLAKLLPLAQVFPLRLHASQAKLVNYLLAATEFNKII